MLPCHGRVRSSILRGTAKNNEMLGSPVTPPALGAGELAGSNPAIPTTMKNLLKDPRFYFFLWIVLSIVLAIMLGGCQQKPLVEQGDVVEKVVVDSVEVLPPHSTIEPDNRYRYFMSDSSEFTSTTKYRVGDTITCVYKKY